MELRELLMEQFNHREKEFNTELDEFSSLFSLCKISANSVVKRKK